LGVARNESSAQWSRQLKRCKNLFEQRIIGTLTIRGNQKKKQENIEERRQRREEGSKKIRSQKEERLDKS
jgi:hypothetical protein